MLDVGKKKLNNKVTKLYGLLIAVNVLIWILAFLIYHHSSVSLGLCLLAYSFGLRHGLDADHIAAIDSVTRKLVQDLKRPVGIGFFFSLGHASVVVILSFVVVLTTASLHHYFPSLSHFGAIFGGIFSAGFLLLFSLINFFIFCRVLKKLKLMKAGQEVKVNDQVRGFFSHLLRPFLKVVSKSWHMFPVGFLFGLGFDTATEVALLGVSAYQAAQHISIWAIMIFPALFAAGMCLVDTTSGLLIFNACRWAYINPIRKLHYNLTITLFSFVTAFLIGIYEILSLFSGQLNLTSIAGIGNHFEIIGAIILSLFILIWLI